MKWISVLLVVLMVFGLVLPAQAHDYDGLGYGNDPGELVLLPFKAAWDLLTLPFYVMGGILGGSYYSRGYGSWYTPSWDNNI